MINLKMLKLIFFQSLRQGLFVALFLLAILSNAQSKLWIPSDSLAIFASEIISTGLNERDMALSPDGKELMYTVVLANSTFTSLVSRKIRNGKLSDPVSPPFTGKYSDLEPVYSIDGNRLYFVSNRPLDQKSSMVKDFDIWYVDRLSSGWSEPKNLGAPVNTASDEFYPSMTKSGRLYFTAGYNSGKGGEDIFYSDFQNGIFLPPLSLSDSINTRGNEFNAFISPDERFIIFSSVRKGDLGRGDLYISTSDGKGTWSQARNLGPLVNSTRLDYCPYVSPDGKTLYITSERITVPKQYSGSQSYDQLKTRANSAGNSLGDIYYISLDRILKAFVK